MVVVMLMAIFPVSAYAAGSFTWDAYVRYGVTSREWTQNQGSVQVRSYATCPSGNYSKNYTITLQRLNWNGWENKGLRSYVCGQVLYGTWTGMESGKFRFVLSKRDDGAYMSFSGNVTYP